jgi:hypothetical protein
MAPLLARFGLGRSGFGFSKKSGKRIVNIISTFSAPGSVAIPAQATSVKVTAHGSKRGHLFGETNNRKSGGLSEGTFSTLQGSTLNVNFAGGGTPHLAPIFAVEGAHYAGVFNGPVTHANSLVIAGGSGSRGGQNFGPVLGGAGGGLTGEAGDEGAIIRYNPPPTGGVAAGGGGGGTQSSGGAGGSPGSPRIPVMGSGDGNPGTALQGGAGAPGNQGTNIGATCGGGGGGYYGGGGGGGYAPFYDDGNAPSPDMNGAGAGGGGGSNYIHPAATNTTNTRGGSLYDAGYVEITVTQPG